ncbi:MAG TPA: NlpC/P60 family protein [Mycobacteriales bacterium]|nr:NlpC/P60 family protein [Mycobacteriales bacterium]
MRSRRVTRVLAVLGVCAGVASTTLAAKSGASVDPAAGVVAAARAQVGDAYAWGATGPDAWDCSGLVYATWRRAGVLDVPRVSRQQAAWAVPLPVEQVLPGDLVFFGRPVTHVGIVTSRTGTSVRMVDAASSRKAVVERAVWRTGVIRYGRVPRRGMPAVRPWTHPAVPAPAVKPAPLTLPVRVQARPSSKLALAAAALARRAVGSPDPGDGRFVQSVWRRAGGAVVPSDKTALAASGRPVPFADARVGDLVFYGPPASHVGLYVGNGLMVDASRRLGKVVLRPVWPSTGLRLVRLPR